MEGRLGVGQGRWRVGRGLGLVSKGSGQGRQRSLLVGLVGLDKLGQSRAGWTGSVWGRFVGRRGFCMGPSGSIEASLGVG